MLVISGLLAELWPSLGKFQQMTITHHFQCKFSLGFQRFWTFFYPKVFTTCHKAIKENPGILVWRRLSKKIWWNVSRLSGRHPITKPKCQKINLCNSPQVVVVVHLVSLHTIFTLDLSKKATCHNISNKSFYCVTICIQLVAHLDWTAPFTIPLQDSEEKSALLQYELWICFCVKRRLLCAIDSSPCCKQKRCVTWHWLRLTLQKSQYWFCCFSQLSCFQSRYCLHMSLIFTVERGGQTPSRSKFLRHCFTLPRRASSRHASFQTLCWSQWNK